jgi:hypothetical protein
MTKTNIFDDIDGSELKEARLVILETEKERDDILEHVIATQGRSRCQSYSHIFIHLGLG